MADLQAVQLPSLVLGSNTFTEDWYPTVVSYRLSQAPSSAVAALVNGAYLAGASTAITGTAADYSGSGLRKVEVGITPGGGVTTWYPATGTAAWSYSWTLPADGIYTLRSRATDTNNAVETPGAGITVTVDNTPPTLTWGAPASPPNRSGWYNTNVSLPFTPADNLAGVASTAPASPLVIAAEGSAVNGAVTVTDRAGNAATFTSPAYKIDKTAPTLTALANPPGAKLNKNKVYANVNVTGTETDGLSGVDMAPGSGSYAIAGTDIAGTFSISTTGSYNFKLSLPTWVARTFTITVRARDRAGNTGTRNIPFVVK